MTTAEVKYALANIIHMIDEVEAEWQHALDYYPRKMAALRREAQRLSLQLEGEPGRETGPVAEAGLAVGESLSLRLAEEVTR